MLTSPVGRVLIKDKPCPTQKAIAGVDTFDPTRRKYFVCLILTNIARDATCIPELKLKI